MVALTLNMIGGVCMLLFGMKIMSEGLQKSVGGRMRATLNFMTGNRFAGVVTGFAVTAIVQSSTAVSVMIVSFVNAGLLSLTQSIGVLFGINIGTTLTAWIISIVGFRISMTGLALPAIGIGFIIGAFKWKYRTAGEVILGFGILFLGLDFLTSGMRMADVNNIFDFAAIGDAVGGRRFLAILIGAGVGVVMTIIINSSTASVALIITMAFGGIIPFAMAAGMIMGAQIGTTLNAVLVALNGSTDAKRTALVHVMFNVIGVAWALPLLIPLLGLVNMVLPGNPWVANDAIPLHLAGLHTTFNIINTLVFLPFVNQYARLICFMLPDKTTTTEEKSGPYRFEYLSGGRTDSPELNILRAEKEIIDMAGLVSSMYSRFCAALRDLRETGGKGSETALAALCDELQKKEQYVNDMREILSDFFVECSRMKLSSRTGSRVVKHLRVIGNLKEMSDECHSVSRLLEKSVKRDCVFKPKEMSKLIPYVDMVGAFLSLLEKRLGRHRTEEQKVLAAELEDKIDSTRRKLQKMGRKRIEAGGNVRGELLFIDLVRRIEKLGDYCFEISEAV